MDDGWIQHARPKQHQHQQQPAGSGRWKFWGPELAAAAASTGRGQRGQALANPQPISSAGHYRGCPLKPGFCRRRAKILGGRKENHQSMPHALVSSVSSRLAIARKIQADTTPPSRPGPGPRASPPLRLPISSIRRLSSSPFPHVSSLRISTPLLPKAVIPAPRAIDPASLYTQL